MRLYLITLEKELFDEWERRFQFYPEVDILLGDILDVAECCIVSPANSYGFMDGGIDLQYTKFFGLKLQKEVHKAINRYCSINKGASYLPVGDSVVVETSHSKIPYVICAPTMELPGQVFKENCFFAMSAMLKKADQHKDLIPKVYCPGLATGIGGVSARDAAQEMVHSYGKWYKKRHPFTAVKRFTRHSVRMDTEFNYIFTDNNNRNSGRNKRRIVDHSGESWYTRKYGNDTTFPKGSQAVIRGLENAFPISTMKAERVQWEDNDFEVFKAVIDDEIKTIDKAVTLKPFKVSNERKIGQGNYSRLPDKFQMYLDKKLKALMPEGLYFSNL